MSIQVGGGRYLIGFDGCFNPFNPSGAFATSITFSTSASLYDGWDWYFDPISFNYERWEFYKNTRGGLIIMLKNKFYKNLFQSLSALGGILIVYIPCIFGYIESIKYESDLGWIMLVAPLSLFILYFLIGFYWIFQKVIIDDNGIRIILINKIIKECKWYEIDIIEEANIMKNPAIRIKNVDGTEIHLDKRKSIIKALEKYSKKKIIK